MQRPYQTIVESLAISAEGRQRLRELVDLLWRHLAPTNVSWLGFYLHEGGDELVLGPMRDKPACSPIGLEGVCGEAYLTKRAIVVHDVASRGASYVACDPRDRSEVVVPLVGEDGACWAVLDLDSHSVGAFSSSDVEGLCRVLAHAGFAPADERGVLVDAQ